MAPPIILVVTRRQCTPSLLTAFCQQGFARLDIGPTGRANADINGAAAAIEMFLGRDALTNDGELRPVRWSQWNKGAGRYQGEIEGKPEVGEHYLAAIKQIEDAEVLRHRFADMNAVLCAIFGVFA